MLNEIKLIGRIGQDIKVREFNGGKLASFTLATSEKWTKNGEKQESTQWHNVTIFNEHLVKIAENYLRKGSLIYLSGQMQYRHYEGENGRVNIAEVVLQKYKGELTMLDSRSQSEDSGQGFDSPASKQEPQNNNSFDDEIPF